MDFGAGECRHKGTDDAHSGSRSYSVAIVIRHGVQGARLDQMNLTGIKFLDRSFSLQAVAGFPVIFLMKHHVEA